MTIQEFAETLDGRQYYKQPNLDEIKKAKELGFIIVCGSGGCTGEIRGAVNDVFFARDGGGESIIRNNDIPYPIVAIWHDDERHSLWSFKTNMPHAEFKIFYKNEICYIGMVIDLKAAFDKNLYR